MAFDEYETGESIRALDANAGVKARNGWSVVDKRDGSCEVVIASGTLGTGNGALEVTAGTAITSGTATTVATQAVDIDEGDPDDPRKDVVSIDRTGTAQVHKGAAKPQDPTNVSLENAEQPAPKSLNGVNATPLSMVTVPAGATSITSGNLADKRERADREFGHIRSQSSTTDQIVSKSRGGLYVVRTDGNSVYVDGPAGSTSGTWSDCFSYIKNNAGDGDNVFVQSGDYYPDANTTFGFPLNIVGRGAKLFLPNDFPASYVFTFNVPGEDNGLTRRVTQLSGFRVECNRANINAGFAESIGDLVGWSVWGNYVEKYALPAFSISGNGHAMNLHHNTSSRASARFIEMTGTGFNYAIGNDLAGGINSQTKEPNWIIGNSIFESVVGAKLSGRDQFVGNLVQGSDERGMTIPQGSRDILISNNQVNNNSQAGAGNYDGIVLGTGATAIQHIVVTNNTIYNGDTTQSQFGSGEQRYGLQLQKEHIECLYQQNTIHDNYSGPLNTFDLTNTRTRVTGNTGYTTEAGGTDTQSGDGAATVFTIAHGLDTTPTITNVWPESADADGAFYVSGKTSTSIEVTYASAPASGTGNLTWGFEARSHV